MKKLIIFLAFIVISCAKPNETEIIGDTAINNSQNNVQSRQPGIALPGSFLSNFNNLIGWTDASQGMNGAINYSIVGLPAGKLKIFTNPNSTDRPKVKTTRRFTAGSYSWRVYASQMGVGDQTSIGAFLYKSDLEELDFEIGYGSQLKRNELNAAFDDLVVYTTSQGVGINFVSEQFLIKRNKWYTLTIDLDVDANDKYVATWSIDYDTLQTATLPYGPYQTDFAIYCSLENLSFIGNNVPTAINTTFFDWVRFNPILY